ncbi:MAG: SAM-dependent methyltransferase [Candidatus Magasanikbacteria bacterium]|nr:SAM-dependent methyltransferase [Candidatus Magasanikbacteria bacterium]
MFGIIIFLFLLFSIIAISAFLGVPFIPTHRQQAVRMIELAAIKPGTRVVDLGSGAGRLLWLAAARGAAAAGYELNPWLYWWTRWQIRRRGLAGRVQVYWRSLYRADLSQAEVVFAFLSRRFMAQLLPKLTRELPPGAKVVSYAFSLPGRQPTHSEQGIFVYEF